MIDVLISFFVYHCHHQEILHPILLHHMEKTSFLIVICPMESFHVYLLIIITCPPLEMSTTQVNHAAILVYPSMFTLQKVGAMMWIKRLPQQLVSSWYSKTRKWPMQSLRDGMQILQVSMPRLQSMMLKCFRVGHCCVGSVQKMGTVVIMSHESSWDSRAVLPSIVVNQELNVSLATVTSLARCVGVFDDDDEI